MESVEPIESERDLVCFVVEGAMGIRGDEWRISLQESEPNLRTVFKQVHQSRHADPFYIRCPGTCFESECRFGDAEHPIDEM